MLKKFALVAMLFAASFTCSASPLALPDEGPTKPTQLQKMAILATGIQQDDWTAAGTLTLWFPQVALMLAKPHHPIVKKLSPVASLAIMAGQRLADNRDAAKSAIKGFKDFLLSHKAAFPKDLFTHAKTVNQLLMAARYCYQAYEATEIVKEYKLACKRLELDHGIVKAVLPPDDSYIQINSPWGSFPRTLWALKRCCGLTVIPKFFAKEGKWDAIKANPAPAALTAFVIGTYFYTQYASLKTFIPKATLEMVQPELKERCEDFLFIQKNSFDPEYVFEILKALKSGDLSEI